MATPFLGEIKIVAFNFAPKGWTMCNGQLLPINQNQGLFSLFGTNYGGDGRTTFGLPDLRGRVPFHMGQGLTLGSRAGEIAHTLNISELAAHTHPPVGATVAPSAGGAGGNVWCQNTTPSYAASPNTAMNPQSILATGGNQPHDNMSPYLVLTMVVALQGIFPSQN